MEGWASWDRVRVRSGKAGKPVGRGLGNGAEGSLAHGDVYGDLVPLEVNRLCVWLEHC